MAVIVLISLNHSSNTDEGHRESWYCCNNIYLNPVSQLFDRLVLSKLILGTVGTMGRTRKYRQERFRKSLFSQLKITELNWSEKRRFGAEKIRVQPPKYSSTESASIAVGSPHPGDSDSVDQRLLFLNKHSSDLWCDTDFENHCSRAGGIDFVCFPFIQSWGTVQVFLC